MDLIGLSSCLVPVTALIFLIYGIYKRVNVYEAFLEGAKEGLQCVVRLLPTLVGLFTAVSVLRAGGILDDLGNLLSPLTQWLSIPSEIFSLSLIRLISSSAATSLLCDIFTQYGPDSFAGRCGSVLLCSTESIFYVSSVYLLSVGITKSRHTIPAALFATICGIISAIALVRLTFGQ